MKNIALVPGVLGFEKFGQVHYFNGIAEHLAESFPNLVRARPFTTDPLGTIEDRSAIVAEQITAVFGAEPVHIFAHSMGGLDSRFLVAQHKTLVSQQVRSITSIGTPHNGSPVATALDGINPLHRLSQVAELLGFDDFLLRELSKKLNALHDLSETVAATFNSHNDDQPGVVYHEVVGMSRQNFPHVSTPFTLPFTVTLLRGQNDGVVPVSSATRPKRTPLAKWAADHADLVGHDLDHGLTAKPEFFDYLEAYRSLAEKVVVPARD